MKILNIDKFRSIHAITIGDATYQVRAMTVGEFINSPYADNIEKATDLRAQVNIMVQAVADMSDIPKDVLLKLDFQALNALVMLTQGKVPTEPESGSEGEDGAKKS